MPYKTSRIPTYRRHSSGQARVTLNGQDHLLGPYGTDASHEAYRRLIAEWLENHGRSQKVREQERPPTTVNEVILAYWQFAEQYYGFDGRRGDEACLRHALRIVKLLYGRTPAEAFGPLAIKACRRKMVEKGWSRTYVNAQVDRVRRMFRWAAEEELVSGAVYQNLRTVAGLRAGRTEARETKKVKPAPQEHIDAALPYMPPPVQAMVGLQLLTGCRPAEACLLRPIDLDKSNPACWTYRPGSDQGPHGKHKSAHHGYDRMILLGPRAQQLLCPWLEGHPADAYVFSPAETERKRSEKRRGARKTRLWPSHLAAQARKRKRQPKRSPGDRYDVAAYRRAIKRACDQAFPIPEHLRPRRLDDGKMESQKVWKARLTTQEQEEIRAWQQQHRWHPNQLRHNRATELRCYGLDLAKTVLGHSKIETTQIYAEKDLAAAMELIARIG